MNGPHTPTSIDEHRAAGNVADYTALAITRTLRFFADIFFAKRCGNRAIVLETVAAVPGIVGGMLVHLRCRRWMVSDHGWIRTLLEEAENERMHLMTFVQIAQPNWFERLVVLLVQAIFFCVLLPAVSDVPAHRPPPGRLLRGAGGHQLHLVSSGDRRGQGGEHRRPGDRHLVLEAGAGRAPARRGDRGAPG